MSVWQRSMYVGLLWGLRGHGTKKEYVHCRYFFPFINNEVLLGINVCLISREGVGWLL